MHDSKISSYAAYTQAAFNIPQLTLELEQDLIRDYQECRSIKARNKIVEAHLRLTIMMAKMLGRYRNDQEDLIQEGNLGLIVALDKYDPNSGCRFAVYAAQWIKAHIKTYIRDNTRLVRFITTKAHQKCFYNLHRYRQDGRSFSAREVALIASELNIPEADVREMETRMYSADHSIHLSVEEGGVVESLIDETDPAEAAENEDWSAKMQNAVAQAFGELDERGRHILHGRWLVEDKQTLQQFSTMYNISPEAIRQSEKRAFNKVQQAVLKAA